jgi:DNA-binding CsgD family transcriptional regulator
MQMIGFRTMRHVILLVYILIFSTGFASLAGLAVIASRLSHPFAKRMIVVQGVFLANLALVALYYYLAQVLSMVGSDSTLEFWFGLVSTLLGILLYASLWYLLRLKSFSIAPPVLRQAVWILIASTIGIHCLHLADTLGLGLAFVHTSLFQIATYLCIALTLLCIGLLLLLGIRKADHPAQRLLFGGIGISCLLFVPLSAVEYLLATASSFSYQPLSLEYVVNLLINITILLAAVKVLEKQSGSASAFGQLSEQTAQRFSLTQREQEMATLIAQGLTNKEIAFKLGISEATVRTHIYNLFQKVGAQSRIELLNLLHD